jgi:DNA modification methylase
MAEEIEKLVRQAIYGKHKDDHATLLTGEWDFSDSNTSAHLHSLHSYPARFIPQIPEKAIEAWSKPGDTVIDPFCGCGTTMLEASILGRKSIGIDNNAVAILISKAKTLKYSDDDISALEEFLDYILQMINTHQNETDELYEFANIDFWFTEEAKKDLSAIKKKIKVLKEPCQTFALAIFSAIIIRASYQDSDTRYARVKGKTYTKGTAFKWYARKLKEGIAALKEINSSRLADVSVHQADARDIPFVQDNSVDLLVTSPPYVNAYDYHKYHRQRIHWIDGDVSMARDKEIGKHDTFSRPGANAQRYFDEMYECFKEWNRVLKPGAKAVIVVGDGIVNKTAIPVGDIFIDLMEKAGFKIYERTLRRLRTTKKSFNGKARIDHEHVLIFENS